MLVFFRTHFLLGEYNHESSPIFDTVTLVVTTFKNALKKYMVEKLVELRL